MCAVVAICIGGEIVKSLYLSIVSIVGRCGDGELAFCRTIKSWESGAPVVVHCASGAGRTGVLLAIDIGLQSLLKKEPVVDILRIVSALRQDRAVLIQTPQQYRFINQVSSENVCYK